MEALERKPVKITENTLLPLSMILVLMGGVVWLTSIYAQTTENTKSIVELNRKQDEYNRTLSQISNQLSEIKGALGMKKLKVGDE